ncbi:MAG: aldo/keto reductase [Deltaproteobacteria bacterium]|nr:aldo/keto reductase [Deltaproteobacteria bacterium]
MKESKNKGKGTVSRREFLGIGGAVIAGASIAPVSFASAQPKKEIRIQQTRVLGRTGFAASDIGMGCASLKEGNLVRYAYDKGLNYFDTAESYGRGASESAIGKAMPYMDRKKIFVTTKLDLKMDDTEQALIDRFTKCLGRLNTDYIDALLIAGAMSVDQIKSEAFHSAVKKLKADGRLKHAGVACHGPRGMAGDSMEKVIITAVEDGRFDIMLFVYNFLNTKEGKNILAACKKYNIGTTAMKVTPGKIKDVPDFDPKSPTPEQEERIKMMQSFGMDRESAIAQVKSMVDGDKEAQIHTKPFLEKYGLKTEEQLWEASIKWVRQNNDMHTVCITMADFDKADKSIAISGENMTPAQASLLNDYSNRLSWSYCRHACNECSGSCKYSVPVSTIMRYSYYYEQGYEKLAMEKYAALKNRNECNAALCATCDAPCEIRCPYGVRIKNNLLNAHSMLTLA